jgi:hypothetical protein
MMFQEMAEMIYGYIIKAEMVFLRLYKVNPFEIMNQISLIDLNTYMSVIQNDEKKEHDSMKKTKIMECLKAVSDYLNVMFYKK